MQEEIPKRMFQKKKIISIMQDVFGYVGGETDWLVVKRQLINNFPVDLREKMSKRHPYTKKHTITSYDKQIMNLWKEQTGVLLTIDPAKLHKDNDK
jgi:hypothetical protein